MPKKWSIAPPWPGCKQSALDWQVHPLVAQILHNRQIDTTEQARTFIHPKLTRLYEPQELPGAMEAAEHIADAVTAGKKIVLYGDYDVDGITGCAILWHLLAHFRADVSVYVPHRLEEGYGLNASALGSLHDDGAELVVTVDCGIASIESAQTARDMGLELIITDHHTPGPQPPVCTHLVHPTALGASPNPDLCGAGVAFKLAWALAQRLSGSRKQDPHLREYLLNATGLAALGTIADVVSLQGENRIIARHGLAGLPASTIVGVQALIHSAGLTGTPIDSYDVGFKLAPRLNAAGRLGHARLAVELLTRADQERAREIAEYLESQNRDRQKIEKQIVQQARERVHYYEMDRDHCRAIVLAAEGWHAGVIGIVASRLVDEFHRPTVLISLDKDEAQGSARSIRHFNMYEALAACAKHLEAFGGHAMAAGVRIRPEKIDAFRESFTAWANNRLTAADLIPKLNIDAEVDLTDLAEPVVRTLLDLGPFGIGNPKPRLASDWLELAGEPRCVGKSRDHLQFAVRQHRVIRKAIAFGMGKHLQSLRDHRRCRVAFEPIINNWQNRNSVELQVVDMQFPQ